MGANVEQGAIDATEAAQDVIETFATYQDFVSMYGEEPLAAMGIMPGPGKNGIEGLPKTTGAYNISGIQALMRNAETLSHLLTTVLPLANTPRFGPFVKPWPVLKAIETRINLSDEGVFATKDEADQIEATQQAEQAEMKKKAEEFQEIESLGQIKDMLKDLVGNEAKGGDK
jgi:hypothetical protein